MSDWRDLVRQGKFAEAEELMLAETAREGEYGYEAVTRAGFYEDWGDHAENIDKAKKFYLKSLTDYERFASWATSGGEGTARMLDVKRLRKKIADLDKLGGKSL